MINGVDKIKLVLYATLIESIKNRNPDKDLDFCKKLAATAINDIYGCHNPESKETYDNNQKTIDSELRALATSNPYLIQPITDSLRVFIQANKMLNPPSFNDIDFQMKLFEKSTNRGLFNKGGNAPEPMTFLKMADDISHKYGVS